MTKNRKAAYDKAIIRLVREHNVNAAEAKVSMMVYNNHRELGLADAAEWLDSSVKQSRKAMMAFRSAMMTRDAAWCDGYTDIDFDALKEAAKQPLTLAEQKAFAAR